MASKTTVRGHINNCHSLVLLMILWRTKMPQSNVRWHWDCSESSCSEQCTCMCWAWCRCLSFNPRAKRPQPRDSLLIPPQPPSIDKRKQHDLHEALKVQCVGFSCIWRWELTYKRNPFSQTLPFEQRRGCSGGLLGSSRYSNRVLSSMTVLSSQMSSDEVPW